MLRDWVHTLKLKGLKRFAEFWPVISHSRWLWGVSATFDALLEFISHRRGTYFLLILTCLALAFCVMHIQDSLMIDEPLTQGALTPSDGLTITEIYVEICNRRHTEHFGIDYRLNCGRCREAFARPTQAIKRRRNEAP
jgi:hypothetical protein